jgi:hypothetical protein
MAPLILKHASASRPSGEWNDDNYDVLVEGIIVGRIFNAAASPVGTPWMWTLAFGHHEDRKPTHGYAAKREARPGLLRRASLPTVTDLLRPAAAAARRHAICNARFVTGRDGLRPGNSQCGGRVRCQ